MPLPNVESWELEKVIEYCSKYLELKNKEDFDRKLEAVADHIKNKDVEYVRELFEVENDFTEEEYEAAKAEAPWAHENLDKDWY
ncbi:hypothetical protein ACLB2K_032423 [Fragaria x ananassa]